MPYFDLRIRSRNFLLTSDFPFGRPAVLIGTQAGVNANGKLTGRVSSVWLANDADVTMASLNGIRWCLNIGVLDDASSESSARCSVPVSLPHASDLTPDELSNFLSGSHISPFSTALWKHVSSSMQLSKSLPRVSWESKGIQQPDRVRKTHRCFLNTALNMIFIAIFKPAKGSLAESSNLLKCHPHWSDSEVIASASNQFQSLPRLLFAP